MHRVNYTLGLFEHLLEVFTAEELLSNSRMSVTPKRDWGAASPMGCRQPLGTVESLPGISMTSTDLDQ